MHSSVTSKTAEIAQINTILQNYKNFSKKMCVDSSFSKVYLINLQASFKGITDKLS
jgi:hypothetical protein